MYDFVAGLMMMAAAGSGSQLPFWATSNQYGLMPQTNCVMTTFGAGNSYDPSKTFQWRFGVEGSINTVEKNLVPAQAYVSAKWKFLSVDLGIKHRDMAFLAPDPALGSLSSSSGHLIESGNARSHPGYNLILHPLYINFKKGGSLSIRGSFGDYWTFDDRYVQRPLVHRLQGYLRYTRPDKRFWVEAGMDHYAIWAGTSPDLGVLPHSFKDYLRIITFQSAGEGGPTIDRENVLGDHGGAVHILLAWDRDTWDFTFQLQRPYNDKSGVIFKNFPDGLYTFDFGWKDKDRWVSDILFEYMYTMWQSGTMHNDETGFIHGGNDNYFNNLEYKSGWSNYGRPIASPFFVPFGTRDGTWKQGEKLVGSAGRSTYSSWDAIENTRLRLFHFGIGGKLFKKAPYKLMLSYSMNYGIYERPYVGTSTWCTDWIWFKKNDIDKPLRQFSLGFMGRVPIGRVLNATYGLYWDKGQLQHSGFGASAGIAVTVRPLKSQAR